MIISLSITRRRNIVSSSQQERVTPLYTIKDSCHNITRDVIKGLNEAYKKGEKCLLRHFQTSSKIVTISG